MEVGYSKLPLGPYSSDMSVSDIDDMNPKPLIQSLFTKMKYLQEK